MIVTHAIKVCERALHDFSNSPQVQFHLARAYYAEGRLNDASRLLFSALEADYPAAFALLGDMYLDSVNGSDEPANMSADGVALYTLAEEHGYRLSNEDWLSIWEIYYRFHFDESGYRRENIMRSIFDDELDEMISAPRDRDIVFLLLQLEEECDGIAVEDSLTLHLLTNHQRWDAEFVGDVSAPNVFDGEWRDWLAATIRDRSTMNKDAMRRIASTIRRDYHDSTLFVLRHSCDSPVFERFYDNLSARISEIIMSSARVQSLQRSLGY